MLITTKAISQQISLAGKWNVALDSLSIGETAGWYREIPGRMIKLPGTTDEAGLGIPNALKPKMEKPQLTHLTRKYSYVGKAWYTREVVIPSDWKGKYIELKAERVLWQTHIWVDGKKVPASCNSLVAPHRYDLSLYLTPGQHHISVCVDNTKLYNDLSDNNLGHAYTNHTQTMWNGMLGELSLVAKDPVFVSRIEIIPQISSHSILMRTVVENRTSESVKSALIYRVTDKKGKKVSVPFCKEVQVVQGETVFEHICPLGEEVKRWSEFTPEIYTLSAKMEAGEYTSSYQTTFGLRDFSRKGNILTNNGTPVFLRGTLECCIFPLLGRPPMTEDGWEKVFRSARAWGLNHLRFHSWCPPEAAFKVADKLGFYLQVELPVWSLNIGRTPAMTVFLKEEAERMVREYGNHPSFCMWSLGNELQGDMNVLADMMSGMKKRDPRHLYTTSSFTFEKGHGDWPEKEDDYLVTQWTKKGWVRGQGVFNSESPTFDKDYSKSVEGMEVPLITHEIGQYAVFPNLKEIKKYKGTLLPLNFLAVKEDLEKKGLLHKAEDYLLASGKLAALLYKEEIERALKTKGISGFQLLDLHDFSGQGTALVGLLDAFWDSKGILSEKEFSQFCAPIVPLLRFPKAVYTNNETFKADIELSNYSPEECTGKALLWKVMKGNLVLTSGKTDTGKLAIGHNAALGTINYTLSGIDKAEKLTVHLALEGTEYANQWNIWIYPEKVDLNWGNVRLAQNKADAQKWLAEGDTVLYFPDKKELKGIEGKFVPVFWSPVHFPAQAGTMGMLCDPKHGAFQYFPTDFHTDWQWWDLNKNSLTMNLDRIRGGTPIVSMVDNFTNNRRLASLFEGKIDNGKLVVCSMDLIQNMDKRPVARQLLHSLLNYMNSSRFKPVPLENLDGLE